MKELLKKLLSHEVLDIQEAKTVMAEIVAGHCNDAQIASILTIYQMRSPTVEEFIGFREALLDTRIPIDFSPFHPIDIVGTGGDGKNTFNISTCACFVVAGAGYKVAKHGNYGATSVSGASNVIESLGIKFTNDESKLRYSLENCNFTYLHAPLFNPAMRHAAPVRKALEVRTIFNLLGPVVNPCLPKYQLLGVADLKQMRLYANFFEAIGQDFAVVNSLDGYDEISLTGKYKVITNRYEMVRSPQEIGFKKIKKSDIFGGNTAEKAHKIFLDILMNQSTEAQHDVVIANAAYAIQVIQSEKQIEECIAIAKDSLDSGAALDVLKKFVAINL